MASETILTRTQLLPRPREEVFAFFGDALNLEAITPPWLKFRVLTPPSIIMRPGCLLDYHLQLFGVPFRWRTEIEAWEPPLRFIDRQLRGPYALWHHTHEFEETEHGTLMRDVVRYRIGWGPLGTLAGTLFVRRMLEAIFDYRAEQVDQLLNSENRRVGQSAIPLA